MRIAGEGVITGWTRGAERLYGYTAAEAIGRHFGELFPPADNPTRPAEVLAAVKAAGRCEREVRARRRTGESRA